MSAPESYQLDPLASEADGAKLPPPTTSVDPAEVRWLNRGGRRREVCKIVARIVSTLLCAVVLIVAMAWFRYNIWPLLCLPGALASFMWDLGEFLAACARHGRGITPKAHIGVELILSLLAYTGGGALAVQMGLQDSEPSGYIIVQCVFTILIATIHLVLFVRACVERSREIRRRRPRVMYIPETGQTVYVVAKPFPELPTRKPQQQQQQQQSTRAPSVPQSLDGPVGGSPLRNVSQEQEPQQLEVPPPQPERPGESLLTGSSLSIKRKPVPGVSWVPPAGDRERFLRPSMRPPPDDCVPSGEELERRRRGDGQPQLMMEGDVDMKFATSATGMTPADPGAREGKYRLDGPARVSGEPSGGGGGRSL